MKLKVGNKAPDFELPDQNGNTHKLRDFRGKKVLIYFYPRDNTPGCTTEACQIRDNFLKFQKINVVVLGISIDSAKSHQNFAAKYRLPFTLLSDITKEVVKKYGVYKIKKFMGKEFMGTVRTSFLIDKDGRIEKIYENVKPAIHSQEVIEDLQAA